MIHIYKYTPIIIIIIIIIIIVSTTQISVV